MTCELPHPKRIQLSDHFKISTILLFSLNSIGMHIVSNTYQVADGFFAFKYISEAAFEAENLIFPPLLIVMYVGLMFGTGASALIFKALGEGQKEKDNKLLSMAVSVLAVLGVALSAALYFLLPSTARWAGASDALARTALPTERCFRSSCPSGCFPWPFIRCWSRRSGLFTAVLYGISMSIAPVVDYHLGKKNVGELRLRSMSISVEMACGKFELFNII